MIRPVIPYIEYAVNMDFIIKNLCINRDKPHSCCEGKCYLEKQLKKSSDTNSDPKDKNTSKRVQNEDLKEFLSPELTTSKVFETNITYAINPGTVITVRFVSAIFIPPKV